MAETDVLQAALAGAHASVYAYGLVGAALTGAEREAAVSDLAEHRVVRDRLADLIVAAGATPTAAAAAYVPPAPVTTAKAARAVAGLVESRQGALLAAAAGALTGADRAWAAHAAQDCAVRAAGWTGTAPIWLGTS